MTVLSRLTRSSDARAAEARSSDAVVLLDVLRSPRFRDLEPDQIWSTLLDEGRYLGSVTTMRRLLGESPPPPRSETNVGVGVPLEGGVLRRSHALLRRDHLLRNSIFLALSVATSGLFGLGFWLVNAHLFKPEEIGRATSLVSAASLISYLSLLGFNTTFIRFLPTSENRNGQINFGLFVCFGSACCIAVLYLLVAPVLAPRLDFVSHDPWYIVGFTVFTAMIAVNLLTDSVFIALRQAQYNFVVDGLIQGSVKIAMAVAFVGLGSFGIFGAGGVAATVAVAASLLFMRRSIDHRLSARIRPSSIRDQLGYSAASYLASVLNLLPLLVLPLVLLQGLGAAKAGYYFIAFQVANILNSGAFAITESVVAEGSQPGADLRGVALHSLKLLVLIMPAASVVLALASPFVGTLFGAAYRHNATGVLIVLSFGAVAVTFNSWTSAMVKVTKQVRAMIWSNVVYLVVIVGLAILWVHRGLEWVGWAWMIGNVLSGLVAAIALLSSGHLATADRRHSAAGADRGEG